MAQCPLPKYALALEPETRSLRTDDKFIQRSLTFTNDDLATVCYRGGLAVRGALG